MFNSKKIFVAGHSGMVGSSIVRKLLQNGCNNIITRTSAELDLRDQKAVNVFFKILHYPTWKYSTIFF